MGQTISQSDSPNSHPSNDETVTKPPAIQPYPPPFSHRLPKILQHLASSDDNHSRTTESTGQLTPPSPLGNPGAPSAAKKDSQGTNRLPRYLQSHYHPSSSASSSQSNSNSALRYTSSTRNLRTEATLLLRRGSDPSLSGKQQETHQDKQASSSRTSKASALQDKRSNPVKFPRRRQPHVGECLGNPHVFHQDRTTSDAPASQDHHQQTPPDESYLERMYDSRTWEMYRRIISHREKVDAFNVANAAARRAEHCGNHSGSHEDPTNLTTVSEPLQRVTKMAEMNAPCAGATTAAATNGGIPSYDYHFYADGDDDPHHHHHASAIHGTQHHHYHHPPEPFEEHSAPPYHHHHTHYCDSGRHHQHPQNHENYSEWEHLYGDVEEPTNGADPAIFLFDF